MPGAWSGLGRHTGRRGADHLRRIDAPAPYTATVTYSSGSVNGDHNWKENFALDDVAAGYYELTIGSGQNKVKRSLWVYKDQTNFVEAQLAGLKSAPVSGHREVERCKK